MKKNKTHKQNTHTTTKTKQKTKKQNKKTKTKKQNKKTKQNKKKTRYTREVLRYGAFVHHQRESIRADAQNKLLLDPLFRNTVCNEMSSTHKAAHERKRGVCLLCVCCVCDMCV